MNVPEWGVLEQCSLIDSDWHPFWGWSSNYIYRIKPKSKVKKWRWVYECNDGTLAISHPMSLNSAACFGRCAQKIDFTEQEYDE